MSNYVRRDGDAKYRKVSIQSGITPQFQEFTAKGEAIAYTAFQVVEIMRDDGTTVLFHEGARQAASYTYGGLDKILIGSDVPLARVWMRRADDARVAYKVPCNLPVTGASVEFKVTGSVQGMELFGDKYFEMVYAREKVRQSGIVPAAPS